MVKSLIALVIAILIVIVSLYMIYFDYMGLTSYKENFIDDGSEKRLSGDKLIITKYLYSVVPFMVAIFLYLFLGDIQIEYAANHFDIEVFGPHNVEGNNSPLYYLLELALIVAPMFILISGPSLFAKKFPTARSSMRRSSIISAIPFILLFYGTVLYDLITHGF